MSLDIGSHTTLADALFELSRDCTPAANFQGNPPKTASARSGSPRANPVQLRFPGFDLAPMVRPEKRPWPRYAPASAPTLEPPRPKKPRAETKRPTDHEMTYAEIARELGISHERVRQIEAKGLRKCRVACEKLGLTPDVFLEHWRGAR